MELFKKNIDLVVLAAEAVLGLVILRQVPCKWPKEVTEMCRHRDRLGCIHAADRDLPKW
jgi:hypothetical protein